MDRKIEKKFKLFSKRNIWIFIAGAITILVLYSLIFGDKSSKLNVDIEKISVAEIEKDVFQDYIAVIGTVEPIRTIYLDAIEGGRVEEILLEEGSMLKKGDVIIRLSNTNLILDISNNEAQVARAINELRTARLLMVQQQMNSESQIIETERQMKYQAPFSDPYRLNPLRPRSTAWPKTSKLLKAEWFPTVPASGQSTSLIHTNSG